MARWLISLGMIAALLGSVYLGHIARQASLTDAPTWSTTGYSLVLD